MMVITGFLAVDDPRMVATIEKMAVELAAPFGLLCRHTGDDCLGGDEGSSSSVRTGWSSA